MRFRLLAICCYFLLRGASSDSVVLLTHGMSTSHLQVLFNAADLLHDWDVYDVRFPVTESVMKYPTRPGYRLYNNSEIFAEVRENIDQMTNEMMGWNGTSHTSIAILKVLASIGKIFTLGCNQEGWPEKDDLLRPHVLIDTAALGCAYFRAAQLLEGVRRPVYVSALVEHVSTAMLTGASIPLSSVPSVVTAPALEDLPSLFVRLTNTFGHMFLVLFRASIYLLQYFVVATEEERALEVQQPSFYMSNSHWFLEESTPRTQLLQHIDLRGRQQDVDETLRQFIEDDAWKAGGFGLLSMSTYTNDAEMPPETLSTFLRLAESTPNMAWIFRVGLPPNLTLPGNVIARTRIPQRTLLEHARCRLMLGHGGQNSFLEAVRAGVPQLLVPQSGDQFMIAERVRGLRVGRVLDKSNLNYELLIEAAQQVLSETTRSAARAVRTRLLDLEAFSPPAAFALERALRIAGSSDHRIEKFLISGLTRLSLLESFHIPELVLICLPVLLLIVR